MDIEKLYKMQADLDKHILENNNVEMSKNELLDNTILALLVEVGELANTTRCFKHWSKKGMMKKEIVLDELADVWHFYLSIGNQIDFRIESDNKITFNKLVFTFTKLYIHISDLFDNAPCGDVLILSYNYTGNILKGLTSKLGFTDEEVEQAYLKKHEKNYKRQAEGY